MADSGRKTRITRFTYWNNPDINPRLLHPREHPQWSKQSAHEELSKQYHAQYLCGEQDAIFAYAKADVMAVDALWVREQRRAWQLEDTEESRKKLRRFMKDYRAAQGRKSLASVVRIILRDQADFKAIVTRNQHGTPVLECFFALAEESPRPDGTPRSWYSLQEMYIVYKLKADVMMGNHPLHIRQMVEELNIRLGGPTLKWDEPHPRDMPSWEEFFAWLDVMAERLRVL